MVTEILNNIQIGILSFALDLSQIITPETIVISGTLIALGLVGFAVRQPRERHPIKTVRGYATPQILYDRDQRPAYYIWVKGRQLRASARLYRRIQDGQRYEVRYTPHTGQVISARRIA